MVLQADVPAHGAISNEVGDDRLAVERNVVSLALDADHEGVPVARASGRGGSRGLDAVDRTSFVDRCIVRSALVVDLDLVALLDGYPRGTARLIENLRFREADENAGV